MATADELAKVHGQSSELVKMVTELAGHRRAHCQAGRRHRAHAAAAADDRVSAWVTGVSKNEDNGSQGLPHPDEDIVERFAKLSPTEQTMLLIKAAYRNPMRPGGIGQTDGDVT